jgi:hypothetical protein
MRRETPWLIYFCYAHIPGDRVTKLQMSGIKKKPLISFHFVAIEIEKEEERMRG